ncbi:hypothetical protein COV53_00010 [Candidatus Gottesmanbacteria bacterium CG11_big_fil_rev_8_21_14_0_20_37_11]|uniref:Metallo-beta-lactamase domain-containing protein n=1 Tax=Candidatus Gottesmanbacteria bacterium CG11_big_fil_rev_8_21_14_0_20_37_11 TaxID=1974575 RepID=A0A2H0NJD9_9BACT|nr:MAG: hypothetical protein COX23_02500 [Candidatus Gottesmanbacteria bacterium CG23_combo_of_CG06-09_8_20_14_all_37_19]PIR09001.1 MAG: hypothetical protein COV53_00010 [Candidatus Gottesmanbacteria bacterium CG11_big_fil_rev_8_21_14_0_20_37_11]
MSLKVITLPVGRMATNCYLIVDTTVNHGLVIDPGDDADYVIQKVEREKCTLKAIIATHGHFDHIMSVLELQLAYNIPFLINKNDDFLISQMQSSAKFFLKINPGPSPEVNGFLENGDTYKLGKFKFKVIQTPGHTPGSICLYEKHGKIIFTGDLLFAGGVGRTDFSYSDGKKLHSSLRKIFLLPENTRVCPGHGPSTTLGEEKAGLPDWR